MKKTIVAAILTALISCKKVTTCDCTLTKTDLSGNSTLESQTKITKQSKKRAASGVCSSYTVNSNIGRETSTCYIK